VKGGRKNWDEHETTTTNDAPQVGPNNRRTLLMGGGKLGSRPDPIALREEILQLGKLIAQARELEEREVERKLVVLKAVLTKQGVFNDPKMKLLLFTEHKDTLDFLAGDGRDGRPLGKLLKWGLSVTQIHGGMKIGDRDTPGTRIYAEREFRESCQVLVATEAAGEGINLQFCWFMINYDGTLCA